MQADIRWWYPWTTRAAAAPPSPSPSLPPPLPLPFVTGRYAVWTPVPGHAHAHGDGDGSDNHHATAHGPRDAVVLADGPRLTVVDHASGDRRRIRLPYAVRRLIAYGTDRLAAVTAQGVYDMAFGPAFGPAPPGPWPPETRVPATLSPWRELPGVVVTLHVGWHAAPLAELDPATGWRDVHVVQSADPAAAGYVDPVVLAALFGVPSAPDAAFRFMGVTQARQLVLYDGRSRQRSRAMLARVAFPETPASLDAIYLLADVHHRRAALVVADRDSQLQVFDAVSASGAPPPARMETRTAESDPSERSCRRRVYDAGPQTRVLDIAASGAVLVSATGSDRLARFAVAQLPWAREPSAIALAETTAPDPLDVTFVAWRCPGAHAARWVGTARPGLESPPSLVVVGPRAVCHVALSPWRVVPPPPGTTPRAALLMLAELQMARMDVWHARVGRLQQAVHRVATTEIPRRDRITDALRRHRDRLHNAQEDASRTASAAAPGPPAASPAVGMPVAAVRLLPRPAGAYSIGVQVRLRCAVELTPQTWSLLVRCRSVTKCVPLTAALLAQRRPSAPPAFGSDLPPIDLVFALRDLSRRDASEYPVDGEGDAPSDGTPLIWPLTVTAQLVLTAAPESPLAVPLEPVAIELLDVVRPPSAPRWGESALVGVDVDEDGSLARGAAPVPDYTVARAVLRQMASASTTAPAPTAAAAAAPPPSAAPRLTVHRDAVPNGRDAAVLALRMTLPMTAAAWQATPRNAWRVLQALLETETTAIAPDDDDGGGGERAMAVLVLPTSERPVAVHVGLRHSAAEDGADADAEPSAADGVRHDRAPAVRLVARVQGAYPSDVAELALAIVRNAVARGRIEAHRIRYTPDRQDQAAVNQWYARPPPSSTTHSSPSSTPWGWWLPRLPRPIEAINLGELALS
ncbi:hypothetical protein CXG81DRAFT_27448 [Caulochytrium protostelioides]|uniref:Uncharacterized protein n=1 Tax=Caulochytrium protostelioides TaxID=1555241 RepID=A0A4P9X448_9FUNG|nr:hypothetical protein CXG81DRAFT_27448 [Caulochytrium protostelioides]|eukprot:RKO99822.1 hypothetical protein CXG81DRAFT_27448 [Caulochytrium protostelioides]